MVRKKKKSLSKIKAQRVHFKRRVDKRFGIEINRHKHREIVQTIQNGKAKLVGRQSNRLTVWMVEIQGSEVKVVYDKLRKTLVTAMTPNMTTRVQPRELSYKELTEKAVGAIVQLRDKTQDKTV